MRSKNIHLYSFLIPIALFTWLFSHSQNSNDEFSEIVKVSLRDIGNQLLLSNQDATSLVLPVVELEELKYQLSFQKPLSIQPDSLVTIVQRSFQKSALPKYYRVEVIQCEDQEVAYSYEMKNTDENSIIPCKGRFLSKNCYIIEIRFTEKIAFSSSKQILPYILIFLVFLFLLYYLFYKIKQTKISVENNSTFDTIGGFQFYKEQNKLIKEAVEISLSKKECEILAIFVAKPNQIIKRGELVKKVWEDNGVIVGRSLDTYISKLRKKLKDDDSVKLINVHGIGYKLEIG